MISNKANPRSKKTHSIDFTRISSMHLADRDFGLLKTRVSVTPFQNINLIDAPQRHTARLEYDGMNETSSSSPPSESPVKTNSLLHSMIRLPSSTPHPSKGVELDPKVLIKRMQVNKAKRFLKDLTDGSLKSFVSTSILRSSGKLPLDCATMGRDEDNVDTPFKTSKKVRLLLPAKPKKYSEKLDASKLSFNERRRLFHWGEYSIAKNGKKMSEILMAEQPSPLKSEEPMDREDSNELALESFIQKHGFRVIDSGKLGVKLLSTPLKLPSMKRL